MLGGLSIEQEWLHLELCCCAVGAISFAWTHQTSFITPRALLVLKSDDIMGLKGQGKLTEEITSLRIQSAALRLDRDTPCVIFLTRVFNVWSGWLSFLVYVNRFISCSCLAFRINSV